MINAYVKFAMEYWKEHPKLSYKKAMQKARPHYYKSIGKPMPKKRGGNPALLAAAPAIAEGVKAISEPIKTGFKEGFKLADKQGKRLYKKGKDTGKYERIKDKFELKTQKEQDAYNKKQMVENAKKFDYYWQEYVIERGQPWTKKELMDMILSGKLK